MTEKDNQGCLTTDKQISNILMFHCIPYKGYNYIFFLFLFFIYYFAGQMCFKIKPLETHNFC